MGSLGKRSRLSPPEPPNRFAMALSTVSLVLKRIGLAERGLDLAVSPEAVSGKG